VPLFKSGRKKSPIPHLGNYKNPISIFDAFFEGADEEAEWGRHNRYMDVGGFHPVLVSRDPGIIKAIQADTGDKPGQFDRDQGPTAGIGRETGQDSLLYANGATWRRQKSLVAKPFSRSNLFQPEKFHGFEETFRQTVAQRLEALRSMQSSSGSSVTRVQLEPEIQVVMLEMLVNNFFGGDVPYEELRDRHIPAIVFLIEHMVRDTVAPGFHVVAEALSQSPVTLATARADFAELTDIALAGRQKGLGLWKNFKSDAPDEALRANIRVFLAGAMEATSSFASWAISHLSHNLEWQDKVYEDVKDQNVYDPEHFKQAPHLNRVLEETLRLTPALYFLPRRATIDTWVETDDGRRMMIPKGTTVRLDVWHANRCEEFWGTKVSGYPAIDFAPERWDELEARGRSAREMLHFGFGHGPRFCPGRSLGLLEVGLVVGAFVKLFRFKAVEAETKASAGVSTKPADGVMVDLELRT